jgi:hypothetical protein
MVSCPHGLGQNIRAVGVCGKVYSPHGRQEAEMEEGTGDQVQPSKSYPQ